MFKKTVVLVASCGALMAGCGTDVESKNQEIISNLVEAGFPESDIMVADDGKVYVGLDAHVTYEASVELLQRGEGSKEHYRTTNLVDTSIVKKICVNPTSEFNSYSQLSAGLDAAIANYNARGLRFTFARGPTTGCTANIAALTTSGAGGSAGFPSGGNPYSVIFIGTGLQGYGVGLSKHIITHELGHAIGLRHSDYYDRSISCGGAATNEEAGDVGAIHIPGTPTTATWNGSIMKSCAFSDETGEWTNSDISALNFLYSNPIDRSESFIRQVYLDVLRREPDSAGFNFHLGTFQSCNGDPTCLASQRVAFARGMLESAENRQQDPDLNPASAGYNAAFVTHCYTNFLQRQPAAAEHSYWWSFLNSTGDYSAVVRDFINSAEYRQRFGAQ